MTHPADDELVARIGRGDHEAYRILVDRYLGRSVGLAERILGNRSDAEDVVQDAFLRVWMHAARWRPGGAKFWTWFYRVVVNRCLDLARRAVGVPLDAAESLPDAAPDAVTRLYRRQVTQRVTAAIARLPGRQRAALALCYYDELSQAEAAEVLGVSIGAVESLLVRARRQLRDLLLETAPDLGRTRHDP